MITQGDPAGHRKRQLLVVLLLVIVAASVYLNTLGNGFVFDDDDLVVRNPKIKDWRNIPLLFKAAWRPLKRLSLMADYHLWGLNPQGFHATNIVLHVAATLSLYACLRALGAGLGVALSAGLLFATHPIHTEAVAVVTHRKEMMGTAFLLLALRAHVRGTFAFGDPALRRASIRTTLAVISLFLASILSKEIVGATFPLLMLAYDGLYREGSPRRNLRRSLPVLTVCATAVVLFLLQRLFYQGKSSFFPFFSEAHIHDLTSGLASSYLPVLATVLRMFWVYVGLLVAPVGLSADHALRWSHSLLDGWVPAAIVGLALLVGLALGLRRKDPLLSLGLLWLPLTILPTANIVPLTPWFLAERFLYLPSVGFCLLVAAGLGRLAHVAALRNTARSIQAAATLLLCVVYAAIAVPRNRDWRSDWDIWSTTARQNPSSILARSALGNLHHAAGRLEEAVAEYQVVLRLAPTHLAAITNLCEALPRLGQVDEATRICEHAVSLHPEDGKLHNNLGNCYKLKGRVEAALREYKLAARLDARLAQPHVNIGAYLAKSGDLEGAAEQFATAVKVDPELSEAHYNLGIVRRMQGDYRSAREHFRRVLELPTRDDLKADARQLVQEMAREGR